MLDNANIIIATMHGKESVIQPILEKQFQAQVSVCTGMNTDAFGTFTRDRKRPGDQLKTCILKAKAALKNSNADFAIASEGSFGNHPSCPFLPLNLEVVVLVGRDNNDVIIGESSTTDVLAAHTTVSSSQEALHFAEKFDFPRHGIIVRKHKSHVRSMRKDILDGQELVEAVETLLKRPFTKSVFLETDLRAHRNPTRMKNIEQATLNLLTNLANECPSCGKAGFRLLYQKSGLPCSWCNTPTHAPAVDVFGCFHCPFRQQKPCEGRVYAEPAECERCNP